MQLYYTLPNWNIPIFITVLLNFKISISFKVFVYVRLSSDYIQFYYALTKVLFCFEYCFLFTNLATWFLHSFFLTLLLLKKMCHTSILGHRKYFWMTLQFHFLFERWRLFDLSQFLVFSLLFVQLFFNFNKQTSLLEHI